MEITEALKTAREAIIEADLPAELQQAAFAEVLRHLLGGVPESAAQAVVPTVSVPSVPSSSGLGRLATRVGVSEAVLADVFDISGDEVTLHVASSRIAPSKSRATKEVALMIAAARQGSGVDDSWTLVTHIRDALQQYNRYDVGNFSTYLRAATDSFNSRGKGASLEIRLTKPGWEMAIDLLHAVAGEAS
jgi:hypothetical protein